MIWVNEKVSIPNLKGFQPLKAPRLPLPAESPS